MGDRRPSSTVTRRRCYEYWVQPDGTLICYMCGKKHDPKARAPDGLPTWEAEHDLERWLGGSDLPPNVKPACRPTCVELEKWGHKEKTAKGNKSFAKHQRIRDKEMGFSRGKGPPVPGSRRSGWKRAWNKHTGRWETVRRDK